MKPLLTIDDLCSEARTFAAVESQHSTPQLYGITDGKAIGTYFEHKFQECLQRKYAYQEGSSARGIDFPEINTDMKVTRTTHPQSSCPFRSARQKIYGLGYSLLIFVYEKIDDRDTQMGRLTIVHTIFVESYRTADFQMTAGILKILQNEGNQDDLVAFMMERYLPVDDIQAYELAEEIMENPPQRGYLTISNALQWRLQYNRVINKAGDVDGIRKVL